MWLYERVVLVNTFLDSELLTGVGCGGFISVHNGKYPDLPVTRALTWHPCLMLSVLTLKVLVLWQSLNMFFNRIFCLIAVSDNLAHSPSTCTGMYLSKITALNRNNIMCVCVCVCVCLYECLVKYRENKKRTSWLIPSYFICYFKDLAFVFLKLGK